MEKYPLEGGVHYREVSLYQDTIQIRIVIIITIFLTICMRKPNDYNLLGIGNNIRIVLLLSSSLYAGGNQMTTTYLAFVIIYVFFYYYLPHCMQAENK